MLMFIIILLYFLLLFAVSRFTARRSDNASFFLAERKSPWYMVAFGMVGASISGVTFVSVPGMALSIDMTYLQMCLGFIAGYFLVAFVLLPVYYRLNLTTIYTYLLDRLGMRSYKTGASFFLLSKMTGAAVRFYVVCMILHSSLSAVLPFPVIVILLVLLIWLYTRRGGIKTLVWTDSFQTTCMLTALILIILQVTDALHLTLFDAVNAVVSDSRSRIFVFDDWLSKQNFWKQFLSGVFVTIVMTGLDQDMMQKNLTCKNLRQAQKDMCTYGFAFFPVNMLFLALGILLAQLSQQQGVALPEHGDQLLPLWATGGQLSQAVVILFTLGIVAASFSSADSALTSLTTSYCIDIKGQPHNEALRKRTHIGMAIIFTLFILLFRAVNSTSIIDAIYVLCSYTYGPLLGLFAFGLLTRFQVNDRAVPYIAVASPLLCWFIDTLVAQTTGYRFGYELLMLNGLLTFTGLWLTRRT